MSSVPRASDESSAAAGASPTPVDLDWLRLREPADAAARAGDLVSAVRRLLPDGRRLVIHDLGCGAGSLGRWLAPRLPGGQHWVLTDRDPVLLGSATADPPPAAADDGAQVTVTTRRRDVTRLTPDDLADADLVTASALLDMFTAEDLDRFLAVCAGPGCPVLLSLSVTGRVALTPGDPLDAPIAAAFNAHQRRPVGGGALLGPDAPAAAAEALSRLGFAVTTRPSPWRLGPAQAPLAAEWFRGWVAAACEQEPGLTPTVASYAARRLAQAEAGELQVTVHHVDLLAVPGPGRPGPPLSRTARPAGPSPRPGAR